ncbi:hypothetical protein [Actinomyces wuliandei]|uniref:hypothetical protein n=1 Tax=Actinomyces wuliandei TaxID=2057743 RepID=UPI00111922BD|nr:hypothetical protein [Actinomyces wuliandei]
MTSFLAITVTAGLVVITSTLYKGQRRARLLRVAAAALCLAVLCRELESVTDGPATDLVKRLAILTAQVSTVLLVLTFRSPPVSRRLTRIVCLCASGVAAGETVLVWFIPLHADGSVLHRSEIGEASAQGQAWPLAAYHTLYLGAFALSAVVVAVGCWQAVARGKLPLPTRFSVGCILVGALGSILFVCSSIADMLARPVLGGSGARSYLLVAVVVLFLVGLTSGLAHRLVSRARKDLSLRLASAVIRPLWTTTTALHPGVRLPAEEQRDFSRIMTLYRLTVETHDALRLIREDPDPALRHVHEQYPHDPYLSAGLVRHLSGDSAVPPLGRATLALTRLPTLSLAEDETLSASLHSLYEIRLAVDATRRHGVGPW